MTERPITHPTQDRSDEIRRLLALSPEEVRERADDRLELVDDIDELHLRMAEAIAGEIKTANTEGRSVRLILPVGPVGQYPHFVRMVRERGLSLAAAHFFFMDEYCYADGRAFEPEHPLSFRGIARRELLDPLGDLAPPSEQIYFPDETNIDALAGRIDDLGGLDACFGGIGIHGHVAFNEPAPGIAETGPRRVRLNDYTITINAVRAQVGGNLECFPREAYTLGLRDVLGARRIVLACRIGGPYDWANTVLRLALFGEPGDDYPVTHIRNRDYKILTDADTLASPEHLL